MPRDRPEVLAPVAVEEVPVERDRPVGDVFVRSGMIRSGSNSILMPSPLHSSQAPKGELNENIRGWSSSKVIPHCGQASVDE